MWGRGFIRGRGEWTEGEGVEGGGGGKKRGGGVARRRAGQHVDPVGGGVGGEGVGGERGVGWGGGGAQCSKARTCIPLKCRHSPTTQLLHSR